MAVVDKLIQLKLCPRMPHFESILLLILDDVCATCGRVGVQTLNELWMRTDIHFVLPKCHRWRLPRLISDRLSECWTVGEMRRVGGASTMMPAPELLIYFLIHIKQAEVGPFCLRFVQRPKTSKSFLVHKFCVFYFAHFFFGLVIYIRFCFIGKMSWLSLSGVVEEKGIYAGTMVERDQVSWLLWWRQRTANLFFLSRANLQGWREEKNFFAHRKRNGQIKCQRI